MRELEVAIITKAVRDLCIHANRELPYDVQKALADACAVENAPAAKEVFRQLTENSHLAKLYGLPLCQDTGLAVFFVEIGQDLHLIGGDITAAINEGVRQGYAQGFLRKSVNNPFTRENTGDNTPAVIHYAVKPGDRLRICFMAKGGGAENMSCVVMLTPAEG
ncbi:MAG: fumarate hydratase, partial [Deltaproteobacteria bacterium]|nr:fumarate hydratase [Deltaproteobacteria bacterium]